MHIFRLIITGTNSGDFAQTNDCGNWVAPGGSCTIGVTFTPTAQGSRTASLSIFDIAIVSPQTVSLSEAGTSTTSAATPTFSIPSATYSSAQTVTISDATPGATIYYTPNGTTPTTASTKDTGAITVSSTEPLRRLRPLAATLPAPWPPPPTPSPLQRPLPPFRALYCQNDT